MRKRIKAFGRDAMTLGVTGVGLGVMNSVASETGGGSAIAPLSKGVGVIGTVVVAGHAMGMINDMMPKKKKKLF